MSIEHLSKPAQCADGKVVWGVLLGFESELKRA
jgi:hypothetical protein